MNPQRFAHDLVRPKRPETADSGRIIGWSMSRRVDRSMYSRKWNHNKDSTSFLMDQRPGLSTRSSHFSGRHGRTYLKPIADRQLEYCWRIHIAHSIAASVAFWVADPGVKVSCEVSFWRDGGLMISSYSPVGHIPNHGTSRVVKILQGSRPSRERVRWKTRCFQQLGRHAVYGGKVVRKRDSLDYLAPRFPGLYHTFPIDSEPDGHPDIATGASRHNLTVAFTDAGTGAGTNTGTGQSAHWV